VSLPSKVIPFVKASACGNDFLLIDASTLSSDSNPVALTQLMCNRHDGVGADGVEWMYPHPSADTEIRLINADGSTAEISGMARAASRLIFAPCTKKRGFPFRPEPA